MTNFEVQTAALVATGVAGKGQRVTRGPPLSHFAQQLLIVSVQGEVAITMVDDGK